MAGDGAETEAGLVAASFEGASAAAGTNSSAFVDGGAAEIGAEETVGEGAAGTVEAADPGNLILKLSSAGSSSESAVGCVDIFS